MTSNDKALSKEIDTTVDEGFVRKVRGLFVHHVPTRLELHHHVGGGPSTVMFWHEGQLESLAKSGPEMVAREIWQHAKDDASGYKGMQRYTLMTWVPGNKMPLKTSFNVLGESWTGPDDDEDGYGFEGHGGGAGKIGVPQMMALMMKMVSESHQLAIVGSAKIIGAQQQSLDRLQGQQEHVFSGMSKILELIENLSDKTFERDMKREDSVMKRDLFKMGGQALKDNLPTILMRFNPAGGNIVEQQLMGFLASVGEPKIMQWLNDMDDNQKAAFSQLYNTLLSRQNTSGGKPPDDPPKTG